MGVFEKWPYTDFHRLNLDWIIAKVKALGIKVDSFEHSAIPTGGTAGQALVKKSAADYDADWATVVGERGPIGPQGNPGPAGPPGPKGADGTSFIVMGRYDTLEELQQAHPTGELGYAYAVGDETDNVVYIWDIDLEAWNEIGDIVGPEGPEGPAGADGADGVGVPEGGTAGQVLAKASDDDYDTEWVTPQAGGGTNIGFYPIFVNTDPTQEYSGGTYSFPADCLYGLFIGVDVLEATSTNDVENTYSIVPPLAGQPSKLAFIRRPTPNTELGRTCTITSNSIQVGSYLKDGVTVDNTRGIVKQLILYYVKNS